MVGRHHTERERVAMEEGMLLDVMRSCNGIVAVRDNSGIHRRKGLRRVRPHGLWSLAITVCLYLVF